MLYTFTRILPFVCVCVCIGYEMGSLSMIEKGFGYEMCKEYVMKFMPFE